MDDVSVGSWIAPRLGPFGGWVGSVVPRGFEAYARVLHPVDDGRGGYATWAEVCAATGRTAHALMQWHKIAGLPETTRRGVTTRTMRWDDGEPEVGNLGGPALSALCGVLEAYTAADCYFALWEGYGWIHGSPSVGILGGNERIPPAFPPEVMNGPRLRHPARDYFVFTGPLPAASAMGDDGFDPQSPNIFWPADRSWCVASEIDFDSTLVAGSAELIAAVLAEPALEAWEVHPDDSLAHDGDAVNG